MRKISILHNIYFVKVIQQQDCILLFTSKMKIAHKLPSNISLIIVLLITIIILQLTTLGVFKKPVSYKKKALETSKTSKSSKSSSGQCRKETCGAIDDVNDPAYNMKNVIKQSILLEEHLAEKNKYCISCIVKHFNHIIGLCEEAVWLAEKNVNKYPYLEDSVVYYQALFEKWVKARQDNTVKTDVLSAIREMRRSLIDAYYLQ